MTYLEARKAQLEGRCKFIKRKDWVESYGSNPDHVADDWILVDEVPQFVEKEVVAYVHFDKDGNCLFASPTNSAGKRRESDIVVELRDTAMLPRFPAPVQRKKIGTIGEYIHPDPAHVPKGADVWAEW